MSPHQHTLRLTPKEIDALWLTVYGLVISSTEEELQTASGDPDALRRVVEKVRRSRSYRR